MTLHTWWLFVAAVFFLCGTPGPNMIHVMTSSVRFGLRRSIAVMLGCVTALIIVSSVSAAGLAALLIASPGLFEVLRYFGVAYLVYLGIKTWREDHAAVDTASQIKQASMSTGALFRGGFLISLSNPKLLLFATAFLPQFVDKSAAQAPQFLILVATFSAMELFWYGLYGVGGQSLTAYMSRSALKRLFNRVTGGLFIGFGFALLGVRP